MRGWSGASAWRPWGIAAAICLVLAVPACFNPQPEPPAKSGEYDPDDNESGFADAATGTGSGSEGGAGGSGGASSTDAHDFKLHLPAVTSGGSDELTPLDDPPPDEDPLGGDPLGGDPLELHKPVHVR